MKGGLGTHVGHSRAVYKLKELNRKISKLKEFPVKASLQSETEKISEPLEMYEIIKLVSSDPVTCIRFKCCIEIGK